VPFAAERNWSAWGFIYITLWSSLDLEAAEKYLETADLEAAEKCFCEGKHARGVVQLGSK